MPKSHIQQGKSKLEITMRSGNKYSKMVVLDFWKLKEKTLCLLCKDMMWGLRQRLLKVK
jgi:hypothetical protein